MINCDAKSRFLLQQDVTPVISNGQVQSGLNSLRRSELQMQIFSSINSGTSRLLNEGCILIAKDRSNILIIGRAKPGSFSRLILFERVFISLKIRQTRKYWRQDCQYKRKHSQYNKRIPNVPGDFKRNAIDYFLEYFILRSNRTNTFLTE